MYSATEPLLVNVECSFGIFDAIIRPRLVLDGIPRQSITRCREGEAKVDLYVISWPRDSLQLEQSLINLRAAASCALRKESVFIARAPFPSPDIDWDKLAIVWSKFETLKELVPEAHIYPDITEALSAVLVAVLPPRA